MKDILDRIADSSPNESSDELICRLRDCAHEIEAIRAALASRPDAQADERGVFEDVRPLVNEWIASRGTSMDGAAYGAAIELAAFVAARAAAPQADERGAVEIFSKLHKFLNAAGAEGLVLDGIDGGDLFMSIFDADGNVSDRVFSSKVRALAFQELFEFQEATGFDTAEEYRAAAPQAEAAQGVPLDVEIRPIVMAGSPNACQVWLRHANGQRFAVGNSHETRADGEWFADQLRKALAAPSPDREQVGETAECCDTPSYCSSVRRCTAQDASPSRECGERHLSNFERTVLEYIAFNEGFINTRMKAREMLDGTSECGEQHVASAPIAAWLHVFSIPGKRTEFASIARDVDIPEDFVRANQKGLVTHVAEPLYRRLAPTLSDSNPTAESPRWYSVDEIRSRLKSMDYCDEIANELSTWLTTEMQLAFNKGFEKGRAPLEKGT